VWRVITGLVSWLEKKKRWLTFIQTTSLITKLEISNGLVSLSKKGKELKTIVQ
jgi:hypothetical protein